MKCLHVTANAREKVSIVTINIGRAFKSIITPVLLHRNNFLVNDKRQLSGRACSSAYFVNSRQIQIIGSLILGNKTHCPKSKILKFVGFCVFKIRLLTGITEKNLQQSESCALIKACKAIICWRFYENAPNHKKGISRDYTLISPRHAQHGSKSNISRPNGQAAAICGT